MPFKFQCAYETQTKSACNIALEYTGNTVDLRMDNTMTTTTTACDLIVERATNKVSVLMPSDITSLCYVIATATNPIKEFICWNVEAHYLCLK